MSAIADHAPPFPVLPPFLSNFLNCLAACREVRRSLFNMKAFISLLRRRPRSNLDTETERSEFRDQENQTSTHHQAPHRTSTGPQGGEDAVSSDNPTTSLDALPTRQFPTSGFEVLDPSVKLEEEVFSWYSAKKFYPAAVGEVFQDTYQVVAKLGYGTASATWLCRDLRYELPAGVEARDHATKRYAGSIAL